MIKRFYLLLLVFSAVLPVMAQPEDPRAMHETAKSFMRSGDLDNAIMVLNRALQQDKDNLEMQKDLVMIYYTKRDYEKALAIVNKLIDRIDADAPTFQIAGFVFKALEQVKECEKMYKKALQKFPDNGPLYNDYGELLSTAKDVSAIRQWEKGIEMCPDFSGNYYNAAFYYFFTEDKVWSLVYGEIFINMEKQGEKTVAMKELLLRAYKQKLFADPDLMKGQEKNKNEFSKAFLESMNKQTMLAGKGINADVLTRIRTRFILDWYENHAAKFPFRLFDYHLQLIREGMFEAYNQWLFGATENLAAYETWTRAHEEEYKILNSFQRYRNFKMPTGQYYQDK